jgi:hypothetical protein
MPDTSAHLTAALTGVAGAGGQLPYLDQIQESFGRHDVSEIGAHIGGGAADACDEIGAEAYATGSSVAFRGTPNLHIAAHEAAHVVQQRRGVHLAGGVGRAGDPYEVHADAVADRVVRGESAEALLDMHAGGGATTAVQKAPPTGGLVPEPPGTDAQDGGGDAITALAKKAIPTKEFALEKEFKYLKVAGKLAFTFSEPSSSSDQDKLRHTFVDHKSSTAKKIGGSAGTSFAAALLKSNLTLAEVTPAGFPKIKVELEQKVLEGKVGTDGKKDLALVKLAGKASGQVPPAKIAEWTGIPPSLAKYIKVTLTAQIEISLDGADAVRFIEMRRKAKELTKHAKELKELGKKAKDLAKDIDKTKAQLRKLRKGGTAKQLKALRSKLARQQRELLKIKNRSGFVKDAITKTTKAVVDLSKKMKTPIGKIAGKMFLKTTGKALAKFIPIAGQVLAVAEVIMLAADIYKAIQSEGGTPGGDGENDGEGGTGGESGEGTGEAGPGSGGTEGTDGEGGDGDGDGNGGPGFECVEGPEVQRPDGVPAPEDEFPSCELPDPSLPLDGEAPEKVELRAVTLHLAAKLRELGVKTKFDENDMLNINDMLPADMTKADIDALAQRIKDGEEPKPSGGDSYDVIADVMGGVKRTRQAAEEAAAKPATESPAPTNDNVDPGAGGAGGTSAKQDDDKPASGRAVTFPMSEWASLAIADKGAVVLNEARVQSYRDELGWDKKFMKVAGSAVLSKLVSVSLSSRAAESGEFVRVTFEVLVKNGDAETTKTESKEFFFDPKSGAKRTLKHFDTDALMSTRFLRLSKGRLRYRGTKGKVQVLPGMHVQVVGASGKHSGGKHRVTFRLKMLSEHEAHLRDNAGTIHTFKKGKTTNFVVIVDDAEVDNRFQ